MKKLSSEANTSFLLLFTKLPSLLSPVFSSSLPLPVQQYLPSLCMIHRLELLLGGHDELHLQLIQIIHHLNAGHRAGVWGDLAETTGLCLMVDGCHLDNGEWYDLE